MSQRIKKREIIKNFCSTTLLSLALRYAPLNFNNFFHDNSICNNYIEQVDYQNKDDEPIDRTSYKENTKALATRGGQLGKSGPGPKAKADATKNFQAMKNSGNFLIPGSEAFTTYPQIYQRYASTPKQTPRAPDSSVLQTAPEPEFGKNPESKSLKSDLEKTKIAPSPSKSPNRQSRIESKPRQISSDYQESDVLLTQKDVRKWITEDERAQTSNQMLNEELVADKYEDVVKNPSIVFLDGNDIYHGQKKCVVYVQEQQTSGSEQDPLVVIADSKTGRSYLGTTLNKEEYSTLQKTGNIILSDRRRDPQTLVKNQKSIKEAQTFQKAEAEGCFTGYTDMRCPYNVSESRSDFVGTNGLGEQRNIELKAISPNRFRTIDQQISDVKDSLVQNYAEDRDIICDLSDLPGFLQQITVKKLTRGLVPKVVERLNFLF